MQVKYSVKVPILDNDTYYLDIDDNTLYLSEEPKFTFSNKEDIERMGIEINEWYKKLLTSLRAIEKYNNDGGITLSITEGEYFLPKTVLNLNDEYINSFDAYTEEDHKIEIERKERLELVKEYQRQLEGYVVYLTDKETEENYGLALSSDYSIRLDHGNSPRPLGQLYKVGDVRVTDIYNLLTDADENSTEPVKGFLSKSTFTISREVLELLPRCKVNIEAQNS